MYAVIFCRFGSIKDERKLDDAEKYINLDANFLRLLALDAQTQWDFFSLVLLGSRS